MTPYRTIARDVEYEIEVKRSVFRCTLARAADEDAARAVVTAVRRRHADARHHCSAYVVGTEPRVERSHDDGEPAGTAGAPMLDVLRRRDLTDVVAVVTRWFGGVLLGTGGLVRAYGSAVSGAVDEAGVLRRDPVALLAVTTDHTRGGALEHALRAAGRDVRDVAHGPDGVRIELSVPLGEVADLRRWLADTTAGTATVTDLGEAYADA